jgi:hypothetical protein
MGRKSALSDSQWTEIHKRLLAGEGVRALAKEYGVSPSRISERKTERVDVIKSVANQMVSAECSVKALSVPDQIMVFDYASKLRSMASNLLSAAHSGSVTSARLAAIAEKESQKINPDEPMESAEQLQAIAALNRLGNDAAQIGLQVLKANQSAVEIKEEKKPLDIRITRACRA